MQPGTALGPGRGSLGSDGAAASRDWERGWSKNVSYSSVFLPGPAPPLPPNKPFPIAQLADRLSARPLLGPQGPDHPPHGSQTQRAAAPRGRQHLPATAPGSRLRPGPSLPHPPPRGGGPWTRAAGVSWGPGPEPWGQEPRLEARSEGPTEEAMEGEVAPRSLSRGGVGLESGTGPGPRRSSPGRVWG